MPNKKRNRDSIKEDNDVRRGTPATETEKKVHNPRNLENVSTAGDESNPKYSKTGTRKDEKR